MLIYLYCKYNAFISYLYFITKVIILKMFIHNLLVLTQKKHYVKEKNIVKSYKILKIILL